MRRIGFIYAIILGTIFYSCQTVSQLSIDYLAPADVSFPIQIKRVGIVNNVSEAPGRISADATLDSILLTKTNGFQERYTLNGDPKTTTEALAETVAAENYFDEVIICDSALQVSGAPKQSPILTREEVKELLTSLDVDMLIALEQIQIKVEKQVYASVTEGYIGVVDAKVYPKVNLYIANRKAPLIMINASDSIFWEDYKNTVVNARTKVISDEQLIIEASGFAGTIPVKHMIPHWKTDQRFFFTNGSSEMRDAAFLIQTNKWDEALPLWEKAYETQKGKKKARVASNISLYYEMKDDLDKAEEWGKKALELINITYNAQGGIDSTSVLSMDQAHIYYNQLNLAERKNLFSKLKMQMDRFNNDF